ncbi:MAG: hypothetical protein KC731_39935, partial [Myxococcales bacterium]|nr:hypothetical protein [Myxococcales bacterium]
AVVLAEADAGFVLCRALDLPPLPPRRWQAADYPWLESRASLRRAMGTGACQAAPRAFFLTHPYDEGYRHWGFEDKDMVVRARRAGLALRFIHHRTSMLHQHHPRTKGEHPWLERRNKLRFWTRRWGLR